MKSLLALTAVCSLSLLLAAPAAEAPGASQQEVEQVLSVVREVKMQQASIAENQTKIDAKLAAIGENVRVARIYSTRGGGKK